MHQPPYDLVLRRGILIDGTGAPAIQADLGIRADRIAAIGDLGAAAARRTLDIAGLVLAPGFIDVHTHDDAALIARPEMAPKLTQGVTTVIAGNCGISAAPYGARGNPPDLMRLIFKTDRFVAPTFADYTKRVSEASPACNAAFLTGHTTLRMQVMGAHLDRTASPAEIVEMQRLLTACLKAGSFGFSTGLFYPPARAASTREVIDVARALGEYQGVYTTHMRDEGDNVMESLRETLQIGAALGTRVIVSHHKCMGQKNFGRSVETLALLTHARRSQDVALDVYPYTAASTVLNAEMMSQSIRTVITWCDPYPQYCGRDLAQIAAEMNCTPLEVIPKLLPAGALYFTMDENDVTRIMRYSGAMIGSDGLPEDKHPHPRLWGTFPRVLGHYVRERHVLELEDAVHRMTGLSAAQFNLKERGTLREGYFADLCIFDPSTVLDKATFAHPTEPAAGIAYVFVNGRMALEDGRLTPVRAGKVLLRETSVASERAP